MVPGRVLLTGGCQVPGLAAALRLLLPGTEVEALTWPELTGKRWQARPASFEAIDVWMADTSLPAVDFTPPRSLRSARFLSVPVVHFSAFHPDAAHATPTAPGQPPLLDPVGSPYCSALVYWAWKRGLGPGETLGLFRKETFAALGYLAAWPTALRRLGERFARCDLHFDRVALRLQRAGNFMHTDNHPRIVVLAALAREVALVLGAPVACLVEPIEDYLVDDLSAIEWPVYPLIGEQYGLHGAYRWKGPRGAIHDLISFVEGCLAHYRELTPSDYACGLADAPEFSAALDSVLHK